VSVPYCVINDYVRSSGEMILGVPPVKNLNLGPNYVATPVAVCPPHKIHFTSIHDNVAIPNYVMSKLDSVFSIKSETN